MCKPLLMSVFFLLGNCGIREIIVQSMILENMPSQTHTLYGVEYN